MRKFVLILIALVLAVIVAAALAFMCRTQIAAHTIGKSLHVPAKIASLEFGQGKTELTGLWIGNPPQSKTPTSFTTERIEIDATLQEVMGNPLILEEITMENIFVGIEVYSGNDNNWAHMLAHSRQKKSPRDYVIRKLILRNLTVQMTKADGSVKTYPTIQVMQFENITSETGFPVGEIEKAIFDLVMKEILRKFGLQQLNDTLDQVVPGGSPLKYFFK
ncbi:MAG TPA: hypothetical protein VLF94_07220 [Chlamydiales bacterium]|nr:hypothetical protein [Chlamydiales bacterium]